MVEVISQPEEETLLYDQPIDLGEETKENTTARHGFVNIALVYATLGLALFLDATEIIAGLLDVPTAGTVGFLIRTVLLLVKAVYVALFFLATREQNFSPKTFSSTRRKIQTITRALTLTEAGLTEVPILGSFIGALPIETCTCLFILFFLPRLSQSRTTSEPEEVM